MAFSRVIKIGDGVSTQFVVNFTLGYIDPSHITARVGNEVDGLGDPVYRSITFLGPNLLQIAGTPAGIGVKIVFERTVPKDELIVDFSDGDVMDEVNLDTSQLQTIMAVQEVLDGRFATLSQDLDFGNWTGTNTRAPTEPTDLANKQYVDSVTGFLAGTIPTIQASLDAAVTATDANKVSAQTSATNAASSAASAASSAASINITTINNNINAKYDKTGGALTGDVSISKNTPTMTLNKSAAGQFNRIRGQTNGVLRWEFVLGDDSLEGGSDAGSIVSLNRYSDAGAFLGYGFTVRRSDGYTTVPGSIEFGTAGLGTLPLVRRFGTTIGGAIDLEAPSTGSTLSGPIRNRINGNRFEVHEVGGTGRGLFADLTGCAASAGSELAHSNNLGALIAALAFNSVGMFGFFKEAGVATVTPGTIVAGSNLSWTAVNDATSSNGAVVSGSWRRQGQGFTGGCTLFIRTA